MKSVTRTCALTLALTVLVACQREEAGQMSGADQAADRQMEPATTRSELSPQTPEGKIANAMKAAPASISADASVMDWPATPDGAPTVIREGSNGWTCFPDRPGSPTNDPMCMDHMAVAWGEAYLSRTEPSLAAPGIAYMLMGGSTASNTEPFAVEPAPGEDWLEEPPHLMIFPAAGELDTSSHSTDPESGGPWVMWAGTPYAHLMVPVE